MVVSTAAVVAVALAVLLVLLALLLGRATAAEVDRELGDRADALADAVTVDATGQVRIRYDVRNPGDAVVGPGGDVVLGRLAPAASAALPRLLPDVRRSAAGDTVSAEVAGDLRVLLKPFELAGRPLVAVVSQPEGSYERVEQLALLSGLAIGLLGVIGTAAASYWVTGRALSPVDQMAASAREWSRQDLDRRFGADAGGGAGEMRRLARTLDDLLDRVAEVIRGEQRLTAELAHELRTPLTGLRGTLDLLALEPDLGDQALADIEEARRAADRMARTITTLLAVARDRPGSRTRTTVAAVLADAAVPPEVVRSSVDLAAVRLRVDTGAAAGALAPLLDNARRHAAERWWVEVDLHDAVVHLAVRDDGPGIGAGEEADAFVPGWSSTGGTGLGLPLARRLAQTVGGTVTLVPGGDAPDDGGGRAVLALPRDRD